MSYYNKDIGNLDLYCPACAKAGVGTKLDELYHGLTSDPVVPYSGELLTEEEVNLLNTMCGAASELKLGDVVNGILSASKNHTEAEEISDIMASIIDNGLCGLFSEAKMGEKLQEIVEIINEQEFEPDYVLEGDYTTEQTVKSAFEAFSEEDYLELFELLRETGTFSTLNLKVVTSDFEFTGAAVISGSHAFMFRLNDTNEYYYVESGSIGMTVLEIPTYTLTGEFDTERTPESALRGFSVSQYCDLLNAATEPSVLGVTFETNNFEFVTMAECNKSSYAMGLSFSDSYPMYIVYTVAIVLNEGASSDKSPEEAPENYHVEVTETDFATHEAEISYFDIAGVEGAINFDDSTVTLSLPYGTDVTSVAATFGLSTGAIAKIGNVEQESGVTLNNFTNPVTYTVIADDKTTTRDWVVTVIIEEPIPWTEDTYSHIMVFDKNVTTTIDPDTIDDTTGDAVVMCGEVSAGLITYNFKSERDDYMVHFSVESDGSDHPEIINATYTSDDGFHWTLIEGEYVAGYEEDPPFDPIIVPFTADRTEVDTYNKYSIVENNSYGDAYPLLLEFVRTTQGGLE